MQSEGDLSSKHPLASPSPQLLLAEAERAVVLQYLRALMQGRLVCRGADERAQAAERLRHDAAQLRELFLGLVGTGRAGRGAGHLNRRGTHPRGPPLTPQRCAQELEESAHCAPVLLQLGELLSLRDPTLLGLEVAGLRQQFPDVRCSGAGSRE